MAIDCSIDPLFTPKVFPNPSPGFPTLGSERAMILNSEGVDEDFTNSFGVPKILNRPSPQGRKPWAAIKEHLRCKGSSLLHCSCAGELRPAKVVKKTRSSDFASQRGLSRNQRGLQYQIIDDKNLGFTHRRSWCGEPSLG